MEELFFWTKWNKTQKAIFLSLFVLLIIVFALYVFFESKGIYNVLNWDTYADFENLTVRFDHFSRYMIDFDVETENFLISRFYLPSPYNTHSDYGHYYFYLLSISGVVALTAISTIKKTYWFSGLITIFIAWLTFLHLDSIGLFGLYNKLIFLSVLAVFVGVAFYFQTFAESASWIVRFSVFSILMGVFLFLAATYSDVPDTLFLLSSNSYYIAILLSVAFIVFVSYDILTLFLFINSKTRSFNPKSNIYNFLAISALYLLIPFLLFFEDIHVISFNTSYFNVFYLLFVSSIIGLWAQKYRSIIFKGNLPYQPIGAVLMVVLALITFATIAYAHATWNTPVIDFFKKFILYSHVAFGISFFAYAVFNFTPALMQNVDVSNYIFNPKEDIPYYTVRVVGFATLFVILYIKNFALIGNVISGNFNYQGDVAYHLKDELMADYYYNQAAKYHAYNFKSSYPLAEINLNKYKYQNAMKNIENALFSEPHPLTYAANQYFHERNNDAFYNIWKLEEGVRNFPNDPYLKNNLAITYLKEGVKVDTCLYLYDQALGLTDNPSLIQSNMIVYCAKNELLAEADSLMMKLDLKDDAALVANKYAIWNALEKPYTQPEMSYLTSSSLYNVSSAYLYNATFRQIPHSGDFFKKTKELSESPQNKEYTIDLHFLKAIQTFYKGNHDQAKVQFDQLLKECKTDLYHYYANIFGLLMFKIEADDIAREYFRKSHESQQFSKRNKAPLHYAFSSVGIVSSDSLASLFREISQYDSTYRDYALQFANIISSNKVAELITLQDYQKVQYLQISKYALHKSTAEEIVKSIADDNLKALACASVMQRVLKQTQDTDLATYFYGFIPTNISNRFVAGEVHLQFLNLLYHRKAYDQLLQEASKLDFVEEEMYKVYLLVAKTQLEKRNLEEVEKFLAKTTSKAPLYVDAIVFKSHYLAMYKKDINTAYNMLVDAIELNPHATELKKAYTLTALDMYMDVFAETTLEDLSYMLPKEDYAKFKAVYLERKALAEERFNHWE